MKFKYLFSLIWCITQWAYQRAQIKHPSAHDQNVQAGSGYLLNAELLTVEPPAINFTFAKWLMNLYIKWVLWSLFLVISVQAWLGLCSGESRPFWLRWPRWDTELVCDGHGIANLAEWQAIKMYTYRCSMYCIVLTYTQMKHKWISALMLGIHCYLCIQSPVVFAFYNAAFN